MPKRAGGVAWIPANERVSLARRPLSIRGATVSASVGVVLYHGEVVSLVAPANVQFSPVFQCFSDFFKSNWRKIISVWLWSYLSLDYSNHRWVVRVHVYFGAFDQRSRRIAIFFDLFFLSIWRGSKRLGTCSRAGGNQIKLLRTHLHKGEKRCMNNRRFNWRTITRHQ